MGNLVFQATLGGQVNLVGPNTASTFNINVPALSGTMASIASVNNNGVIYVNSSGQPTTGTALVFDGSYLGISLANASNALRLTSSTGTNGAYQTFNNTGNTLYVGVDNSAGSALGFGAYAAGMYSTTKIVLQSGSASNSLTLDTSGNLGLGVTPSAWYSGYKALQVGTSNPAGFWSGGYDVVVGSNIFQDGSGTYKQIGASYRGAIYKQFDSAHSWYTTTNVGANTSVTPTQAMTLAANGNFYVGATTSANHYIKQVNGTLGTPFGSGVPSLNIGSSATNNAIHGIGDAGAASYAYYSWYRENVGATDLQFWNYTTYAGKVSGSAWFQGNNSASWSITSDIRLKQNIRGISDAIGKVMALKPCHFEYKTRTGEVKTGFIANEFEQVFPNHVHESLPPEEFKGLIGEGEKIKCIDADLIPYLTAAIQEQQAIITTLTDRITALEAK
jgi:hypothetical protein